MFYEAESLEAVRSVIESDIYYTSGVVSYPALSSMQKVTQNIYSGTRSAW
jgi:hypothetical protein